MILKKVITSFLVCFLVKNSYASGAVAFSSNQLQYFIAINKASKDEAINSVFNLCKKQGASDCKLSGATHGGGYGAIAKSKKRLISSVVLGYETQEVANQKALDICNKSSKPCRITDSWQDVGRIVEVPARRGCINSRTGASDYYCTGIDVNGQPTF